MPFGDGRGYVSVVGRHERIAADATRGAAQIATGVHVNDVWSGLFSIEHVMAQFVSCRNFRMQEVIVKVVNKAQPLHQSP